MNLSSLFHGSGPTASKARSSSGSQGTDLPSTSNIPGPMGFVYGVPDLTVRPYGAASTVNLTQGPLHPTQQARGVWRGQRIFARALPKSIVGTPYELFGGMVPSNRSSTIKG